MAQATCAWPILPLLGAWLTVPAYFDLLREWKGAATLPRQVVNAGMCIILLGILAITYGNYLGASE